jgi:hypothetical protein
MPQSAFCCLLFNSAIENYHNSWQIFFILIAFEYNKEVQAKQGQIANTLLSIRIEALSHINQLYLPL